jgi:predicted phage tail protein
LTTIALWGELGDRYPAIQYEASTFKEALQGLFLNYPSLKNELIASEQLYQVVCSKDAWSMDLTVNHADFPVRDATISIVPVIEGSGNIGKLIGGLALVAIGVATGGTGLIISGLVMGLQGLFFGNPKAPNKEDDPKSSIIGSGSLNTAEGNTIPIVCGLVRFKTPQLLSFTLQSEYKAL